LQSYYTYQPTINITFAHMKYSSKILEDAVEAMSALPSIGKKSALRLILHLADSKTDKTQRLIEALKAVDTNLQQCTTCHNYSDHTTCDICKDPVRNKRTTRLTKFKKSSWP